MSQTLSCAERLRKAFEPDARGVVGVVDELLAVCGKDVIRFEWKDGVCRLQLPEESQDASGATTQSIQVQLPKSVFRAVLARLAALCNEQKPDSVSPYGGTGEIAVEANPPKVLRVVFTNTPAQQDVTIQLISEINTAPGTLDSRATSQNVA